MAPSTRSLGAAMLATAAASPLSLGELRTQVGGDVALRVLPIGDAATYGSDDAPNGYRAELAELLEKDGNKVEIVGSTLHGAEPYNAVEASSKGETIDELLSRAETAVPGFLPNVVVLNAGTADCEQGADGKEAGDKVVKILELTWDKSRYASVVLATSPLPDELEVQQCVDDVNNKFRNLVEEHQNKSHKVVLVDLDADKPIDTDDEGLPTEEGYKTVAQLLFDGVDDAGKRGWLEAPEDKPEDAPEASEEDDADSTETSEGQPETTQTTAAAEKRQEVNTSTANTALPTSISKEELDALMDNVMDDTLSKWGWDKRQEAPRTTAAAEKRQEVNTSTANTALPTSISKEELDALMDNVMDDTLSKWGYDKRSLPTETEEVPEVVKSLLARQEGGDVETESSVFSPPLDGGSPTTAAPEASPTDFAAIREHFKELIASGQDVSSILPEGVSPEDILPNGASDLGALGNQRRQEDDASETESGVFSPPLDGGSPTTPAPESASTDPTAFLAHIKELIASGQDVSSLLPEGVTPEDILGGGADLGVLGNQRRQKDDASETPTAVFSPPLDGGSPTTTPEQAPTDPTAILSKVEELLANGQDVSSLLPEGVSPEDILPHGENSLGEIGNQRRQEGGASETPTAVFSPPLDGGSPTTTPESAPTDPTAILSKIEELLANGQDIESFLPEGTSLEDLLPSGVSDISELGNQRRQETNPTALPTSVLTAFPSETAEAIKAALVEGDELEDVALESLLSKGPEQLQARATENPTKAVPQPEPTDTQNTAVRREVPQDLEQILPSGVTLDDLKNALPSGVKLEDFLPSATEALKDAVPTDLEARDSDDGLAGLVKDLPGVEEAAEALPSGIIDARDSDGGLAGLVKDLPGVEEAAEALPSGIIEARSVHSSASNLVASSAAVLAAVGLGFAMI